MSSDDSVNVDAVVIWNSFDEGCIEEPFSGIQPSFAVGGDLIMCKIESREGLVRMERGGEYAVRIKLPYGKWYSDYLHEGMRFKLQAGGRVIGSGVVEKVARFGQSSS